MIPPGQKRNVSAPGFPFLVSLFPMSPASAPKKAALTQALFPLSAKQGLGSGEIIPHATGGRERDWTRMARNSAGLGLRGRG